MQLERCDLIGIVRDVVQDLQTIEQRRQITLRLPEEDSIPVVADSDRIGQVLSNYLTNAIKYSPADQPIEVAVLVQQHTREVVRVAVSDHGPGLSASEQQHIWERFYQSPGRKDSTGSAGLGLGLYICRNIIEHHHGHVGIDSIVGKGSTFWFTLPLRADEKE